MLWFWNIAWFNALRFFAYPHEFWALLLRRAINLGLLLLFWSIVLRSAPNLQTIEQMTAYFLMADGIANLTMSGRLTFANFIERQVRRGELSSYLLRPTPTVLTLYATMLGKMTPEIVLGLGTIFISTVINPPQHVIGILLFPIFMLLALAISFAINVLIGSLAFHLTEAKGFRNSAIHIMRIFSGLMIPLSLFPGSVRVLVESLPFAGAAYIPTTILSGTTTAYLRFLTIEVLWAILLLVVANWYWRRSLRAYEAVGI